MTTMPSNRPLSPFALFQRFKRSKILEAREKNGDDSSQNIQRIIMAVPGLEDYSSAAVDALSPEDLGDLRRIKIRAALDRDENSEVKDAVDGWEFVDVNKMMSAGWQAIDEFGSAMFEELAEEGRSATPPAVSPVITPQLHGDDDAASAKEACPPSPSVSPEFEDSSGLCLVQEVTFPRQLMDIIEHQSTAKGGAFTAAGERVLEWLPAGDAFIIRDKGLLEKEVLPKHFTAKSKFMSFVRKLYRWGFRQLEKDSRGILIFSHSNFKRGDKKRCLKMRSVVKKSPTQAQKKALKLKAPAVATPDLAPKVDLQAFRASPIGPDQYYGRGGPRAMGAYVPPPPLAVDQDPPAPRPVYPFVDRCGSMNPLDAMGYRGPPSPMGYRGPPSPMGMPGHYSPTAPRGMTSAEMFKAALRMERQERREEMLKKMQMMDMLRGGAYATHPPLNQRLSLGPEDGYRGNSKLRKMSDVELAYETMKQVSRMEALQALEFAKQVH